MVIVRIRSNLEYMYCHKSSETRIGMNGSGIEQSTGQTFRLLNFYWPANRELKLSLNRQESFSIKIALKLKKKIIIKRFN